MKTIDLLLAQLEEIGTEYIFGIPGGALEPLNNAIYKSGKIEGIVSKHEQGAAFMADGYARVSRRLGVCCGTSGPGATNLITGIASAYADSIPVMALTGQVPVKHFGRGAFQDSSLDSNNIVNMFSPFTKMSTMISSAEMAGSNFRQAIRTALTGRPGPVHLNLPLDIMETENNKYIVPADYFIPDSRSFDRYRVNEAVRHLLESRRIVMMLGHGVSIADAAEEARQFAEILQIPVVTTPKGKGVFPENHPLSLGVFGCAGSLLADDFMLNGSEKIDCILAVGTSFSEWGTHAWDERLEQVNIIIQIDIDHQEVGKNYPFTTALLGDAKVALRELHYEAQRRLQDTNPEVRVLIEERERSIESFKKKGSKYAEPEKTESNSTPVLPQRLIKDIQASLPEDTLYFVDIGNNWAWSTHYLEISHPRSFFTGLGFASMGYAAAASIGGKFAAPERPVVAIVGDGGFLMNGQEVACAVNYNRPVIWIILNDSGYGMIDHGRKMRGIKNGFATRFNKVDFVKMAQALGAEGIALSKPGELTSSLMDNVIASGRPTVIDVEIDENEAPPIQSRIKALENIHETNKKDAVIAENQKSFVLAGKKSSK